MKEPRLKCGHCGCGLGKPGVVLITERYEGTVEVAEARVVARALSNTVVSHAECAECGAEIAVVDLEWA